MKTEDVEYVVDGKTGRKMSEAEHAQQKNKRLMQRFVRGPIPASWVQRVNALPKSAGALAWGIAYLRGLEGKDTFRLRPARLREVGVSRSARERGLAALEQGGLVVVRERRRGCAPLVEVKF
ncbi:MAG: hypothetical protein K1X78_20330 [Verrucomicrobiaceae bacterium]|nr:hypothetical protein [Verrucomicrobiaceae bacterium]